MILVSGAQIYLCEAGTMFGNLDFGELISKKLILSDFVGFLL